jgi:hypothetical protein
MRLILPLLAATALGAVVTLAAAASVGSYAANVFSHAADNITADADRSAIVLASDDDDEHGRYLKRRCDDDDGDDSEDDDNGDGDGAASNPAPVDTVSPPTHGLFGNGPAPQVQVK